MTAPEHVKIPTLLDVAELANVSTATVSRCLNSPDMVGKKTRAKVMNAVEKLGYAPNFGARALAAKRTFTVGAVIPTMDNAIFARGLQAFQEELHSSGITLLVASSQYDPEMEAEQIRALVARGADALLLIGHHRAENIYRLLDTRNIPTVVAWAYDPSARHPSVGFDNRAAMQELASEVLAQGHRRLAFITAPTASNDRARMRLQGIRNAMKDAGLDPSELAILETPYSIENGSTALKEFMSSQTPPTAVMCGNDVLAIGALRAARQMGLSVPDDLSITGFDDIELAELAEPPLTTVHVPHRDMGRAAARALVTAMTEPKQTQSQKLPTSLKLRGTLAQPAKALKDFPR